MVPIYTTTKHTHTRTSQSIVQDSGRADDEDVGAVVLVGVTLGAVEGALLTEGGVLGAKETVGSIEGTLLWEGSKEGAMLG
mmetsp:Transcript_11771/g.22541  ORF Transcript_11771/g.22541 Transcript_11771/m.22541 type:complete len:81 (+) Transcript_11771:154-396(+)